jgi:hypothetical protein
MAVLCRFSGQKKKKQQRSSGHCRVRSYYYYDYSVSCSTPPITLLEDLRREQLAPRCFMERREDATHLNQSTQTLGCVDLVLIT